MRFTEGEISMNQVSKVINVFLRKENERDYLVFDFEDEITVCLNDDNCQSDLKKVFSKLLERLMDEKIELKFKDTPEYKTGLYIEVCEEYIKDLNREISTVCKNIPERLKIKQ